MSINLTITIISHDLNDVKSELWYDFILNNHMHEITCYHASRFVQNGSFPWIRTTISGSRDRRNAFIRGRNTMPYERMLPYVHMTRNLFCPHLIMDECRSGRRIRTAIREYESRVSHEYFIPVRVLFSCARNACCPRQWPLSRRPHAMQRCLQSLHSLVTIRLDGFNQCSWWIVSSASIMRAYRAPTGIRTRITGFVDQIFYPIKLSGQLIMISN